MADRGAHVRSLAVDKFTHGEDFDQWVDLFEMAVGIAYRVNDANSIGRKQQLCLEWFPLMIDQATFTLFSGITADA